jgi:hypothetical protein
MVLTQSISWCSFVDRDMFMRHFGHGVGHLQCERQQENDPNSDNDMALEDSDDVLDSADGLDTGDSDPGDLEICHDSDEKESHGSVERSDGEGVDWGPEGDASDISDGSDGTHGSDCDGYTSY